MVAAQESGRGEMVRLVLAIGLLLMMAAMSLFCVLRDYRALHTNPRTPMMEMSARHVE